MFLVGVADSNIIALNCWDKCEEFRLFYHVYTDIFL